MSKRYRLYSVFGENDTKDGEMHAVILDEDGRISSDERQAIAASLHLNETIFVDDAANGDISIFTLSKQIPFAGTAALAAAAFICTVHPKVERLHSMGSSIVTSTVGDVTWVEAKSSTMPSWNFKELLTPEEVLSITDDEASQFEHTLVWSWLDRKTGVVRARTFASDWGSLEVEGNGSGSMLLSLMLGREITVIHGSGVRILARPGRAGYGLLGGKAVLVDELELPSIS